MKLEHFSRQQIKNAVAEVRQRWGSMWDFVGPEVRNAFVEQHALKIVLTASLTRDAIDKAVLQECLHAMRIEASVLSKDE